MYAAHLTRRGVGQCTSTSYVALDMGAGSLARESHFHLLEANASGELDLFHAPPSPLRVVLLLPRRLLQDPIFIERGETLLALFRGGVWR